jgi:16S rRNA (guanine527-N7)-methyltransferase
LIGPREASVIWTRHLLNCAGLLPFLDSATDATTVIDVGSGAGLPGLVIALARPTLRVTLVEPMQRRCAFLTEAVELLGLTHVSVRRGRAAEFHTALSANVVTARAVAPLSRLVPETLPLLRPGGVLLAIKGSGAADEVAAAHGVLAQHRATAEIRVVNAPGTDTTTTVVCVRTHPRRR